MTEQQLPEGWQMVKFGDIAKHISKRVEPSETDLEIYVGLEHLDSDSLKIKRHGTPSDVEGQKLLVKKGQIIFGKRRAYQRKVAVADWDCICSAHAMVLEANSEKIIPEFLPFFMQSDVFMERAIAISEGSLSPTIKWKVLREQAFPIPCKKTQLRFLKLVESNAAFLNKTHEFLISGCDLISTLEVTLFTKGIDANRVRKETKLGLIPQHWELAELQDIAHVTDGAHRTPTYIDSGIPFLRVTDIQSKEIDLSGVKYISEIEHQELCKRCHPEKGDILLSKNGTIGITKIVDWDWEFSVFVSLCLIKIKRENINPRYIQLVLQSELVKHQIKARSKTGTITNLHLEEIREFLIPIPQIKEQIQIVEIIERAHSAEVAAEEKCELSRLITRKIFGRLMEGA
ncbi:restriction endonuclease subunit S [Klebsiella pneumoniae]|uniref:restriction endonuclease subunit S n=1 Tax=Klebsiella pneumoniae TaxID=573 RepID=UPI003985B7BC